MELDKLFQNYGSDKDRNGYTPIYHSLFKHLEEKPIDFMEIGIGTMIPGVYSSMVGYSLPGYAPGGSLRAWRDFFKNGRVVGVDIQPDTQFEEERIQTFICNSLDSGSVDELFGKLDGRQFDVILDDGSHFDEHQVTTLRNFFKYVKPGGYYIIEDLNPGSRIRTSLYPQVEEIVGDALMYFATVNVGHTHKTPILIISKRK